MNLEELLRKRLVEKTERDAKAADSLLLNAERDLKVAEGNLKMGNSDWALAIAYNAMLSSGRALMAREGYRATSESHHFAVVQFCATFLPEKTSGLANAFNRYRVRRHDVVAAIREIK